MYSSLHPPGYAALGVLTLMAPLCIGVPFTSWPSLLAEPGQGLVTPDAPKMQSRSPAGFPVAALGLKVWVWAWLGCVVEDRPLLMR